MVLLSDGSDDEAAAAAQAVAQQERRLARQQRAKARAQATCQLFEEFDQFTQKRWATVKLLAEHGFVEQSQRLAADVQILQDCCDANRALIGKFADQHADRRQHAPHAAGQDPQDRQPAGQGPAGPPAASLLQDAPSTDQHLHGSTPAPQQQPARAAPPPPPPPLPAGHSFLQPAKGRPALPGGARLVGRPAGQGVHATSAQGGPAKPPPPPPGPPPAHKWSSSSSTSAAGGAAAGGAGSSTRGPAAPPPPPPGPPPPHSFAGAHSKGPSGASSSKGLDQQQQRQGGSSPRPPPPPPPLPPVGLLPGSPCRTLTTTNSSSSGSSSPMPAGRSPGKAPPPPPPLPPGGFLGGGPSLRSPVSRPRTAPGACGASTNNSSPSGTPAAAGVAAGGSAAGGGTMGGLNPIAAAAAAAGARRALQDGAGPEPSTPKGALLRSHQHHHSFSGGVSSIGLASPLSADGLAGGAGGAGGSCGKLKRLHVDPVPQHRMTNGSFWRTTEDVVRPFQAEFEYALRSMFSNTPASGRRAAEGAGGGAAVDADDAAGRVIKVIADKRALQVEVCIKRLRMDASKLAAALNRIDTDKLKQDDLPQIRSMLPKPDELSAVAAAKKKALKEHAARVAAAAGGGGGAAAAAAVPPEPRLGVVEEAFEALGGVRMLMAKMRACEFKYDIEAVGVQVDEFVTDLSACLDAFRTCGQLQYLLAFVRDVANTMNASAVAGGAAVEGLKLESLNRLQSTRMVGATDLNLLHYIVAHLSKAMPWVLAGLEAEREAFKAAMKRGTFDTVLTRVRGLRDMHKRISTDLKKAEEHLRHTTSSPLHSSSNKAPGTAATSNTSASSSTPALAEGADPAAAATPAAVSDANPAAAGSLPAGSPPAAAAAAAAASEASDAEQRVYIGRLSSLLRHAGCRLEGMTGQMERLMQQFRWTAEFFCEDVGARWKEQPAAFILHFADLLDAIEAAKKDTARIAKVNKVLTQFDEERQRQEEEAAEAAAAEAAAAAAAAAAGEDGCYLDDPQYHQQLCFRGEEEEQRQYGQGVAAGCDDGDREGEEEDGEQQQQQQLSRLTLTNSWVLGVARSLQFGSSRSDEEQEEQQGAGPAASTAAAAAEGRRVQRVGGSSGAQQLQGLQQQAAQASTSAAAAAEFAGDQPQQQVHPQQQQQQSDGLALPVTYWHNDMLAGTWGSSLSVVSGGDRLSTRTGSTSSSRSSTGGSNSLGGGVTAAAAAAAAAAADAPAAGQQ